MKKILTILLFSTLLFSLAACNNEEEDKNVIYVTTYPVKYLVEQIAGDDITVKRVPGSQVHSESIDWSAKDIINMINADLLFYVNGGLDTYIENNKNSTFDDGSVELVDISATVVYNEVCYTHTHSHEEEHTEDEDDTGDICSENMLSEDPHFWLDPVRMLQAAELVRDKLVVKYPDNSILYQNNFTVLQASLEKLDEDFQKMADQAIKPIITTSMLFTYWSERYAIEIMSLTTSTHASDSIPSDIIEFVDEAQYHYIHYIMFEKNSNSPAGEKVLEELKLVDETASALYLHGLGSLTTEELQNGLNYISIMYNNLDALKTATK